MVVHLTSGGELHCRDGTSRRPQAGDITLYDDTTGEGNRSRGDGPSTHLLMYLDPAFDLDSILAQTDE
jgi:hypothetical protein